MKDRKILVEVTPEEYEKIVAGNLEKDLTLISTQDLLNEIIKRSANVKEVDPMYDPVTPIHSRSTAKTGKIELTIEKYDHRTFEWIYKGNI